MSYQLPNGSVLSIAASYGTTKTMSAVSNAVAAVATLEASHGVVVNDILEVLSGWSRLNNKILRASVVATNDVTLEGFNTTDTNLFPATGGTGSVREIATWATIPQILEFNPVGGEQQYTEFQFLEDKEQRSLATVRSAQGFDLVIADDPTLAVYDTLRAADTDGLQRAFRLVLPDGKKIYYNGTVTFNDNPRLSVNNVNSVTGSARFTAKLTRYAT